VVAISGGKLFGEAKTAPACLKVSTSYMGVCKLLNRGDDTARHFEFIN